MAHDEHLAILLKGIRAWNAWRGSDLGTKPDLSGANLSGRYLRTADFSYTDLRGANLSQTNLGFTDFSSADLTDANLADSKPRSAEFINTDLTGADLTGANFDGARFDGAELEGANFDGANISLTAFVDVDLSKAKGLAQAQQPGPSSVGIDTFYKSKGRIPESFLRGCGVPESFITQMHALIGAEDGIQFYSCFISYSSKDEEFARRLHGRMRDAHLRVWFAAEDIQGGKKLHEQIETAIRVYDKLLIVLSEASLQSEWVMTELRKARKAERQSGERKLFPVRLVDFETLRDWECFDADGGKDLAVELREYFIPDFSNWKNHDAFEAAFARLLKDLKAVGSPSR
ncbi:MAG TPA: toll/interleukin-1 receptor domain-containing protein [Chthoniobacteraceae bacterium]|jgi:uncharacterized protein YjbI with pentapeptide repeats